MEELLKRLKLHFVQEETMPQDEILLELLHSAADRIALRTGEAALPALFESICVEAATKLYRRLTYEGISSEGEAAVSFVEDVLAEYAGEFDAYAVQKTTKRAVRFL